MVPATFTFTLRAFDTGSDYQLDGTLARYVDSTVWCMTGSSFHNIACDKSRVGTLGLSRVICNGKNQRVWPVPQVGKGEVFDRMRDRNHISAATRKRAGFKYK